MGYSRLKESDLPKRWFFCAWRMASGRPEAARAASDFVWQFREAIDVATLAAGNRWQPNRRTVDWLRARRRM
jgi:hypothetical protein